MWNSHISFETGTYLSPWIFPLTPQLHQPSWNDRFVNSWWRRTKSLEKNSKTFLLPAFLERLSVCIWCIQMESEVTFSFSVISILTSSTYHKWWQSYRDNVGIKYVSTVKPVERRHKEVSLSSNSLLSKMCHNLCFRINVLSVLCAILIIGNPVF